MISKQELVEDPHFATVIQQPPDQYTADIAGSADHQNLAHMIRSTPAKRFFSRMYRLRRTKGEQSERFSIEPQMPFSTLEKLAPDARQHPCRHACVSSLRRP